MKLRHVLIVFFCIGLVGCDSKSAENKGGGSADKLPEGVVELLDFTVVPTSSSEANGVTLTADRFGTPDAAFHFNGQKSFLRVEQDINPEPVPELTLTLWTRPTGELKPGVFQVISHDDGGFDRTMGLDTRSEQGFGWSAFAGNKGPIGGEKATVDEWIMLTTVYDQPNKTVRLYVNDRQISINEEATLGAGNDYLHLGGNPGHGEHYQGDVDDVRIYHRALSTAEVKKLYKATKP